MIPLTDSTKRLRQAIIYSRTSQNYRHRAIFDSARGFLFFATRHSGNYYDAIPTIFRWYAFATSYLLRKFDVMPETAGVVALAQDADIERSNIQFNQHKKGFRITCFYEGLPIRALGFKVICDISPRRLTDASVASSRRCSYHARV